MSGVRGHVSANFYELRTTVRFVIPDVNTQIGVEFTEVKTGMII